MSDANAAIILWFVFVTAVMMIAIVQSGFERGRRFSLRNLFLFASLLSILVGLFVMLRRG